ncbi:MAG: hypothetical protein RL179_2526, partial [Planctomycetota bacterium]
EKVGDKAGKEVVGKVDWLELSLGKSPAVTSADICLNNYEEAKG